ncbi:AraC family transcriptional regulator [Massilia sp. MB5]|uniref:AraC family transcriptional regulator n=1 Tax=unclassified Massilia TaxID=2609279 RepID=UPI00067B423F|nr:MULTISPECIES: AraC family transcriptional regulator [unclassified Massilia]AKU21447.1 AraC family transcriptional regulator [Massilia sp. NR 4-1]UMR28980.1 AraC family transcriptional regulator [Massilia sp. MB5]
MSASPDPSLARQARMAQLIDRLAPDEGYTLCALPGLRFMRANRSVPRTPVLYEPSIVVVCSGRKRGYVGGRVYHYNAQQFLVLSVPLPFEGETDASEAEPMLAMSIPIDLQVAAEIAMELDQAGVRIAEAPLGIMSSPLDDRFGNTLLRLLEALLSPVEARLLGPGILREILYCVMTGSQGGALRAALTHRSQFGKISKALLRIHRDYTKPIDVATLAQEAGMSLAAFHASFKAVTLTSPIQYLKTTRLHKARLLMAQSGLNAATASSRVGYESSSQFSREFKRYFGRTPLEEARQMRGLLTQAPGACESPFVSAQ